MIQYTLSQKYPHHQFLQVTLQLKNDQGIFNLKLPEWRPGRYQLGNFSKYLRSFEVRNQTGNVVRSQKINRNTWQVLGQPGDKLSVTYEIFTSQIDGGSTYVDEKQWYLNFINCILYPQNELDNELTINLKIPEDWEIACGLPLKGKTLKANSFYQLFDSPAICSNSLQHLQYESKGRQFHMWFMGDVDLNQSQKILNAFQKFTDYQIETMGSFDDSDYHFLFQILPYKAYHGVEHLNSTCIVLGPAKDFFSDELYDNFLGISSHELFHYWNIIRIRPQEMWPYKFDQENYFTTGYVAEGVTTYYGDLFLIRSGVNSLDWYLNELNKLLKRHLENYGRNFYSLAESSMDLWVDGYEAGIPSRKVSIYVKGALIALILDLKIIKQSEGKFSLDDVLRNLWSNNYKRFKGYTEEEYLEAANGLLKEDIKAYRDLFIYGKEPIEDELQNLLNDFGFEMHREEHESDLTSYLGAKISDSKVVNIAPDSPADENFRIGDEIVSIDGKALDDFEQQKLKAESPITILCKRNAEVKSVVIEVPSKKDFYCTYQIKEKELKNAENYGLRKKWLNI